MTKCVGCRVRHLNCDTYATCTECERSGRDCVRLHVRFRHLVCPSKSITRADYSKYEFFFDDEQTWVDTGGKVDFVFGGDCSTGTSPIDELQHRAVDPVCLDPEPHSAPEKQSSSTFVFASTFHAPTVHTPVLEDGPPDYLAALAQAPDDSPGSVFPDNALEMPARSSRKTAQNGETLPFDRGISYIERVLPATEPAGPLKSLQEGKLLQHFVTHLAPWVRMGVFSMPCHG